MVSTVGKMGVRVAVAVEVGVSVSVGVEVEVGVSVSIGVEVEVAVLVKGSFVAVGVAVEVGVLSREVCACTGSTPSMASGLIHFLGRFASMAAPTAAPINFIASRRDIFFAGSFWSVI